MKKILLYFILFSVVLASGCKDFLDLPPKNRRAVTTLDDVKSVLAGYLDAFVRTNTRPIVGPYPIITEQQNMMFEAYSDNFDFAENMNLGKYIAANNYYGDEKLYANKLLFNDMDTPDYIWTNYYQAIGFLNALIDQCDELRDADPAELKRVKGEMLVHRAFYAFKLQQYFAPMNDEAMGIPLYLHTGQEVIGVKMERLKQSDVYGIILNDLTQALGLYEEVGPKQGYNRFFNNRFIQNLLAQVYWFKAESSAKDVDDYKYARDYALAATNGVDAYIPQTLTDFRNVQRNLDPQYPAFYMESPAFTYVAAIYGSPLDYIGFAPSNLVVAADLYTLFEDGDLRKEAYFTMEEDLPRLSNAWPDGINPGNKPLRIHLFAPEEAYLILAESYYKLDQPSQALSTLNHFKSLRGATERNDLSGTAILTEIIHERRKEFFTDTDKRWLDLKRYNLKTIERTLRFFDADYTVKVEPGDYHYALPIPLTELQENPNIIPNGGWNPIVF